MKLSIDSKNFIEGVAWATKGYDAKDSDSYIALVVNDKGKSHLHSMTQTAFFKSPLQVLGSDISSDEYSDGEIKIALDGAFLKTLAGTIRGETVLLEMNVKKSGDSLSVTTEDGSFTVPTFNHQIAPEPTIIQIGEVDDREFFDSLQRLSKICESEKSSNATTASVDLNLEETDKKLILMATDKYALGEVTMEVDLREKNMKEFIASYGGNRILIPGKVAKSISSPKGLLSSVTLIYEKKGKKFGYLFGDGKTALFSLTNGDILAYKQYKDTASASVKNYITIDNSNFHKAIDTVSKLAWSEKDIFFTISEGYLKVSDSTGKNKVKVLLEDSVLEEDSYSIKFHREILSEGLSPISTEKLRIKWGEVDRSFILEALLADGTLVSNVFVFIVPSTT